MFQRCNLLVIMLVLVACNSAAPIVHDSFREFPVADSACFGSADFNFNQPLSPKDHIVRMNNDGHLIAQDISQLSMLEKLDPALLSREEVDEMYHRLFCDAERLAVAHKSSDSAETVVKLLVYVHGGLNSFNDSDRRVIDKKIPYKIMNDSENWHYPIFVSWDSSAAPTWFEHTFHVREGRKVGKAIGWPTAPFMIASDMLRSVGRYPATAYFQITNEKDRLASAQIPGWLSQAWVSSILRFCDDLVTERAIDQNLSGCTTSNLKDKSGLDYKVNANLSNFYSDSSGMVWRGTQSAVTFPLRYTVGSLWHSGISATAWDNMKRRTQNIFNPPWYFDGRRPPGIRGAEFFQALLDWVDKRKSTHPEVKYEITLVGHSMGTIAINSVLDSQQARWATSGALKNIVYMAAAANIADSLNALGPVLSSASAAENPINFYNLTLNRVAEVSEMHFSGVVPLGSLLVSIDHHHELPEHPLQRTLGSEINVLSSIDVIDRRLRGSTGDLVFKAFDRCEEAEPRSHGEFGDLEFWNPVVWKLNDGRVCNNQRAQQAAMTGQ
ncbi:MAG: hypothetical protein Q8L60_09890 [Gammaproteobacteria bacterium]|nr:hypothetical protein [Gammaproteobacteria bacterium]MDP2142472.1 hypothetical protein [Gammaproteobacteria bacterium]MDP2346469.1 hypothetical protein [Gammaproteobacteria bacterium]